MTATKNTPLNTTTSAGVPPAPSKASQQAYAGATRTIDLNGSRLHERHDGKQWLTYQVTPINR